MDIATEVSFAKTAVADVLRKAKTPAVDKAAKKLGVRREIWYIKGELDILQFYLMAAEARQDDNNILRTWAGQVRDLAYEIEDCLAEILLLVESRGMWYMLGNLCTLHQIASNIRYVRAKVQEISHRSLRYNLIKPLDSFSDIPSRNIDLATLATPMSTPVVKSKELLGQSKPKKKLIKQIIENNENRKVIWITGMGGVGKTTLAKQIYDSNEVRHYYTSRVWITISQMFDERDLLWEILKQISGDNNKGIGRVEQLIKSINSELENNKAYIVVLDDMSTIQAWNIIEKAFPNNKTSSRVIVTTRNIDVAKHCNWNFKEIYPVEPLSNESSRNLLLRNIYKSNDFPNSHRDLEDTTNKIIKVCEGLPLAIVTIGGLLASKPINKEEWENLLNCIHFKLENNPTLEAVKLILDLSYNDLPSHLKHCLLYLSIFPVDFEIRRCQLVYRWMAEGFVRERYSMTLEEVAKEYFYELINRNLIQPSDVGDDGTIKSCRVHDILRELLIAKSIEKNLVFITGEQDSMTPLDNICHLIVTNLWEMGETNLSKIRSVSIFGAHVPSQCLSSHSKLKLLRILDFRKEGFFSKSSYNNLEQVIRHLGQFEHLKYLSLPKYYKGVLPESLESLRDLQTLDMKLAMVTKVPNNITKLQKLRHLFAGQAIAGIGIAMAEGIGNLKELQVLDCIDLKRSHSMVVQELAKLHQLKRLGVTNLIEEDYKLFSASVSELSSLRSLRIRIDCEEASVGCLDSVSLPPQDLRNIKFWGWIGKLPAWFSSLHNLAKVTLFETRLDDDAIVVLQELRNLVLLQLRANSYVGVKLTFRSAKFPKLRILHVWDWRNLREMLFEEDTLPELETLEIWWCQLKSGISGIEYLPKLEKLALNNRVYVANLDVVQKQVLEHQNRPVLVLDEVQKQLWELYNQPALLVVYPEHEKKKELYKGKQKEAEEAGPSHAMQE